MRCARTVLVGVLLAAGACARLGFDPDRVAGGYDVVVASFDAGGARRWWTRLGGAGDEMAYGVAAPASGAVFVTGSFSGTTELDDGPIDSKGAEDVFLLKLSQ